MTPAGPEANTKRPGRLVGACEPSRPLMVDLETVREATVQQGYLSLGTRRTGSVHEFYRYPARFTPDFARSVVNAFSQPGQVVLDPFVGGGTTLVESRLAGRVSIGADVNELAVFVTEAKTIVHTAVSLDLARRWLVEIPRTLSGNRRAVVDSTWTEAGYLLHLGTVNTWRIRNVIAQALESLRTIGDWRAERLVRCAVLRTGQWALDMREHFPSINLFRDKLASTLGQMIDVAEKYADAVLVADRLAPNGDLARTTILQQGLPGLSSNSVLSKYPTPSLICTSPPYPGVYVNYHRWKVGGRKESPAPYWVANCLDGHGMSHYTLSAKASPTLDPYFERLTAAWTDLARIASESTWVVQLVGFSQASRDLPRYLKAMEAAGFEECQFGALATAGDGRLWRDVPGRRWWVAAAANEGTAPGTGREVVLVHRLRTAGGR